MPLVEVEDGVAAPIPRPGGIAWPAAPRASKGRGIDIGGALPVVRERRRRAYEELLEDVKVLVVEMDQLGRLVAQLAAQTQDPEVAWVDRRTEWLRQVSSSEDLARKRIAVEELEAQIGSMEQRYPALRMRRDAQ